MIRVLLRGARLTAGLAALCLAASAAQAATPGNLDELLEQTRQVRQREAQLNAEREKRFVLPRNENVTSSEVRPVGLSRKPHFQGCLMHLVTITHSYRLGDGIL